MPSLRDFLPPPPWEGPPIPKILTGKGGNDPPHQLEVDATRGVLYVHNLLTGITTLRVCKLRYDVANMVGRGLTRPIISLKRPPVIGTEGKEFEGFIESQKRRPGERIRKVEPVFFQLPIEALSDEPGKVESFSVVDESGKIMVEFREVPIRLINDLRLGEFVDITLGYTGKE